MNDLGLFDKNCGIICTVPRTMNAKAHVRNHYSKKKTSVLTSRSL